MFFAHGAVERGAASIASLIVIDRDVQVYGVRRRGVCFDTRFVPPRPDVAPGETVLWCVLRGEVRWSSGGLAARGPCVWALTGRVFDGERGRRAVDCHACGEPFEAVMVRVRSAREGGDGVVHAEMGDGLRAAVDRFLGMVGGAGGDGVGERAHGVLRALADAGWTEAPPGFDHVDGVGAAALAPLWRGIAVAFRGMEAGVSLKTLAAQTGRSMRSMERLAALAQQALLTPSGGWRETTRTLRTRLAVMLLSTPSLSISEVASAVGYSRPEAMANAFQNAGLPPPLDVRRLVRAEHGVCPHPPG